MKQIRLFIATLLTAILPMTIMAQGTEIKEFMSTFTGNVYGIAHETYSEGTLTTAEGNNWTWNEGGEPKSPVIKMVQNGGLDCLSVKPKTGQFVMSTDFSVPGDIQQIFCTVGGNIGTVILDFGNKSFQYGLNYSDDGMHSMSFSYDETMQVQSTNINQAVKMIFLPKDESADATMYIRYVSISTKVSTIDDNDIVSTFGQNEGDANTLLADDGIHHWSVTPPTDGTELEKYNTQWNDERCTYLRTSGGTSSYPKLKLQSDFRVEGKLKKVIVKAGGNIRFISYTSPFGDWYESEIAESNIPYFKEFTLDFGNGLEVDGSFSFDFYAGRNTFLKSITLVMEGGAVEFSGLTSTFSEWEPWDVTESAVIGLMKSKESTPWVAYVYDASAYIGKTTYTGVPTALTADGGTSNSNECIVIGDYSNQRAVGFELMSQFPITGHVKKVVVRAAGQLSHLASVCHESSNGGSEQYAEQMVNVQDGFYDVELFYDGVTEYEDAVIRIFFDGYEPIFLQSITIVQDEDANSGLPHGKCGDNLEYALTELPYTLWIWNPETGQPIQKPALKLTITGTGDMYDYDDWQNMAPWRGDYREQIGEIELPEGLTRVGTEAFDACYNAHINSLPSTIQSIGSYAFWSLSYWPSEDLHLPDGLTSIEYSAFRYCSGIKNLYLPASLTYIGDAAICGITDLENYYVDEANPYFKIDNEAVIEIAKNKLVAATKNTVIPDYIEEIGSFAFYYSGAEEIPIPESVVTIGSYAFSYSQITKLVIPDKVTKIGYYAFYACKKLETVIIGKGVTKIESCPFYTSNNVSDVFCFANPDELSWTSSSNEEKSFKPSKETKMHVYSADLEKWETNFSFLNVTFVGDLEDWEDGIKPIEMEDGRWKMDDGIYDLSGRKLPLKGAGGSVQLPKGIYIQNGKKFLVK